ncbi:hypothetical protein GPECTOR_124g499 [Gonium pectorale]|uniref:Reverse transcriptase domain-containing protein n=1 Tax=Gonium pectorale TaxID=33097 RepID=A0A150FYN4_GONPE|nr:hypothetical protein GPECTOR_124g499 [Gonium pectorale]|eukprot:KXZ42699.1 hypothetical protein GPECTOR_124g499 [Gonium pectorale]
MIWQAVGPGADPESYLSDQQPQPIQFPNHAEFVTAEVAKGVQSGVMAEWRAEWGPPTIVNGLRVVEGKKLRLCMNPMYVNQFMDVPALKYESVKDLPGYLRRGSFMFTTDDKSRYRNLQLHPSMYPYAAFEWQGRVLYWPVLAFGFAPACWTYSLLKQELFRPLRERRVDLLYLIDDCLAAAALRPVAQYLCCAVVRLLSALGFTLSLDKCQLRPAQRVPFLGFIVDTEVPPDKHNTSIKKAESQIVEVEEKLSEPGISEEEKQRLRKKEDYLRKKEEQLRKEKEQLREEKLLLRNKKERLAGPPLKVLLSEAPRLHSHSCTSSSGTTTGDGVRVWKIRYKGEEAIQLYLDPSGVVLLIKEWTIARLKLFRLGRGSGGLSCLILSGLIKTGKSYTLEEVVPAAVAGVLEEQWPDCPMTILRLNGSNLERQVDLPGTVPQDDMVLVQQGLIRAHDLSLGPGVQLLQWSEPSPALLTQLVREWVANGRPEGINTFVAGFLDTKLVAEAQEEWKLSLAGLLDEQRCVMLDLAFHRALADMVAERLPPGASVRSRGEALAWFQEVLGSKYNSGDRNWYSKHKARLQTHLDYLVFYLRLCRNALAHQKPWDGEDAVNLDVVMVLPRFLDMRVPDVVQMISRAMGKLAPDLVKHAIAT